MSKKILLVLLEFDNWGHGRSWSYTGGYAFLDGLRENGHDCTLLPYIHGRGAQAADNPTWHAPALLAGETFDEAWIWCNHAAFAPEFWDWLKSVAPVRVGITLESLNHSPEELTALPFLDDRHDESLACLRHCTHALACDEADAAEITRTLGIPSLLNVFMVPERFVREDPPPSGDMAAFIGAAYYVDRPEFPLAHTLLRNRFLADPRLAGVMNRPHFQLPERNSQALPHFEALHREMRQRMLEGNFDRTSLQHYGDQLHALRGEIFTLFLEGLRIGLASVNLPSLVKSFPGRVIEAMAASVPCLSWVPPERPLCASLFTDGEEFLAYDSVPALVAKIDTLRDNPALAQTLVNTARQRLLKRHTSAIRCRQYSTWLSEGTAPIFNVDRP